MRLISISLACMTLILSPLLAMAETNTATNTASQHTVSINSNLLNKQTPKPLVIYQQALNYLLGRNGVAKSSEKAASLFKSLAEQNWSSAQHMLGNMYFSGKGVEKNDLLAYKWLSLASRNNLQLARAIHDKRNHLYSKLREELSPQSLSKVETWIAEWKPSDDKIQIN